MSSSTPARRVDARPSNAPAAVRALVRKYEVLYTDQLSKKRKTFKDGFVKVHHLTRTIVLVDSRDAVLDELLLPPDSLSGSGPLPDTHGLHVDEEIDFERHLAVVGVGHLVDQRYTVREQRAPCEDLSKAVVKPKKRKVRAVGSLSSSPQLSDMPGHAAAEAEDAEDRAKESRPAPALLSRAKPSTPFRSPFAARAPVAVDSPIARPSSLNGQRVRPARPPDFNRLA